MIISHTHRVVILAPWKTASQTILARLGHHSENPYALGYEFNPVLRRVVHQHMTLADISALPESRLGYRTAAFVRNPYDRVYSGFLQLQRDIVQQPNWTFPDVSVHRLVMGWLTDNRMQIVAADHDFNRWLALVADHQIFDAGINPSFPLHPAHYWTHEAGVRRVDWIGRVENFEPDFGDMCATFGLSPSCEASENVSTEDPCGDHFGYRHTGRMTPESIAKINRLFGRDFELFGYRMLDPEASTGARRDTRLGVPARRRMARPKWMASRVA